MSNLNSCFSCLHCSACELLDRGVFAFVGEHMADTGDKWRTLSAAVHVPYVNMGMPSPDIQYGLNMVPQYTEAMLDVIHHYGWTKVHYMYTTLEGG